MARIDLLRALHRHCRDVGVRIEFDRRCDDVIEFAGSNLIVAADGANSTIRTRYAALETAQAAVEQLYTRWAELEEKRAKV